MKTVEISIIISTYNEEKYLPSLLQSIKDQTAQPSEVIIADANSTDQTRKIALSFGCKVIQGGSPQRGRNNGADVARNDNLLFLDADNVLPKTFLENTAEEFERKNLDFATCFVYVSSPTFMEHVGEVFTNSYYKITEKIRPHVYGFCIFVKKKLHNEIKGFDEAVVLADDQEYALRAGKKGKFGFLTSEKLPVAMRRYEKEGKVVTSLKCIVMELHLLFLGPIRKQIFSYRWGKF